jgi:uncharacterized protein (DUF2147 family)
VFLQLRKLGAMTAKVILSVLGLVFLTSLSSQGRLHPATMEERICGKWESTDKNLILQVCMKDNKVVAQIVWFSDTEGKPLDYWTDIHNPNPALRSRKILGMNVVNSLTYKPETNSWEDGIIYDSKHGREWNASAYIDKNGLLKVKGYWHFKFIGKTMTFNKIA